MKKRIFRTALIVFGIAALVMLSSIFLRRDEGFVKNHDFYKTDEQYDVLYLGSSHAVMGILPMEIWNEYGITSFNLANGGQKLTGDYWILKNALEQKKPELVVLDAYGVMLDTKWDETTVDFLHGSLDPMPLSKTKVDAVYDLVPEEKRIAFLWPFSVYHNRWQEINKSFFKSEVSYQKGAYENTDHMAPVVATMDRLPKLEHSDVNQSETVGKEYLRKCIKVCQEYDVPILLTVIPFYGSDEELRYINSIYEIAEEYQVPYINGLEEDVVNPKCDFLDSTHLNSSGARKWSSFLGAYMKEHYQLNDYREDEAHASWNENYMGYRMYEQEQLNQTADLYAYLMLLADGDFTGCIKISPDAYAYKDKMFWMLLENMGVTERPEDKSAEVTLMFGDSSDAVQAQMPDNLGLPEDVDANVEILVFDTERREWVSHVGFHSDDRNQRVYPAVESE